MDDSNVRSGLLGINVARVREREGKVYAELRVVVFNPERAPVACLARCWVEVAEEGEVDALTLNVKYILHPNSTIALLLPIENKDGDVVFFTNTEGSR